MLRFPLPCLLQGCRDTRGPARTGSGAGTEHWSGWRMDQHMGCAQLLDAGCWVQSWEDWVLLWWGVGRGPPSLLGG